MARPRTPVAPRRTRGRAAHLARGSRGGSGSGGRTILASAVILGALVLFAGLGLVVWRALPALPRVEEIRTASADAATGTGTAAMTARAPRPPTPAPVVQRDPQAQLERVAAAPVAAPPAGAAPQRFKLVIIESAGEIDVRSRKLRLAFVDAPAADARCTNASGTQWPCGARARTALRRLVRARALDCRDRPAPAGAAQPAASAAAQSIAAPAATDLTSGEPPAYASCTVGGTDLSRWLVEQGWGAPAEGAPPEFAALHAQAREQRRGLYQTAGR